MWVVLVRQRKFRKEVKCHRHYFERKSDAEAYAKIQNHSTEVFKIESSVKANDK